MKTIRIKKVLNKRTAAIYLAVTALYILKILISLLYNYHIQSGPRDRSTYLITALNITTLIPLAASIIIYAARDRLMKNTISITLAAHAILLFIITTYDNTTAVITAALSCILYFSSNHKEEKKVNLFFITLFLSHASIMTLQLTGIIPLPAGTEYSRQIKLLQCSQNILFETLIFCTLMSISAYVNERKQNRESDRLKNESILDQYDFTPRQREAVRLLLQNKTTAEIAKVMNITENTLKSHKQEIYRKMMVKNQIEFLKRFEESKE